MKNTITVNANIIYETIRDWYDYEKEFEIVQDEITSADDEDGGAQHEIVLKDLKTNKFYSFSYSDWDMDNSDYDEETREFSDRCDLAGWDTWHSTIGERVENTTQPTIELHEVFPKTKLVTYYE